MQGTKRPFKVAIVRHGERVDHVFGAIWTSQFFDGNGQYVRRDLNMPLPENMPVRPIEHWAIDPPLTELGRWQARQVGSALASVCEVGAVVCSPALRCLQTAEEIRQVLPSKPGVVTEPGLYEMTSWGDPKVQELWLASPDKYAITSVPPPDEGIEDWYERSAIVFRDILERHQNYGKGDLLIIAHGLSHEVLTYHALWQDGHVPDEIRRANGHEAKVQALCNACRHGLAPVDTFCGAAILFVDGDGAVMPMQPSPDASLVPLWMTHRQNLPFIYKPLAEENRVARAQASSSSNQAPKASGAPRRSSSRVASSEGQNVSMSMKSFPVVTVQMEAGGNDATSFQGIASGVGAASQRHLASTPASVPGITPAVMPAPILSSGSSRISSMHAKYAMSGAPPRTVMPSGSATVGALRASSPFR